MNTLRAIDALNDRIPIFEADRYPADLVERERSNRTTHVAIVEGGESGRFLGLLGLAEMLERRGRSGEMIFGDLVARTHTPRFRPDDPLEEILTALLQQRQDAAAVVDESGRYLGALTVDDIERRFADKRTGLAEMNAHLAHFSMEHAGEAVYWVGPDARILYVNQAACRMTGYSREELLDLFVHDLDPNFPAAAWPEAWEQGRRERSYAIETQHIAKDGHLLDVEIMVNLTVHRGREFNCCMVRDITGRKRMQAELLRRSEGRYRAIFEQAAVGVAQVALDGRWVDVNRRLCDFLGYPREELLATTFQAITHPDDLILDLDQVRAMLAGEIATYALEKRYRRKDGVYIWGKLTRSLVRDEHGEPLYFVSVVEDIDARKQAEAKLADAAANIELMVRASNIGLWEWDLSTKVIFSGAWRSQLGYDEHEIIDEYVEWERRVHPDDLAKTLARLRLYLADPNSVYEVEFRMRHKDGSWRWIYSRGDLAFDASGKPTRMRGCHVDMTEYKRLMEAAKASEEFLREALDALAASTALVAEDGRIVTVNRRWREFAMSNGGDSNAVSEGINYLDICDAAANEHPEAARIGQLLRSALAGKLDAPPLDPPPVEYPCHSATEQRWYQAWVRGFKQGTTRYAVVSHEDVTSQRMVAMSKQRETAAAVAASVAHEFSGLLFAISLAVDRSTHPNPDSEGAPAALARDLIREAQVLSGSLLDLYASPDRAAPRPISLYPWLPETVSRLARAVPTGIKVTTDVEFDLPEAVAHALGLEQVLRNLLFNAVDALGEAGEVRVTATRAVVEDRDVVEVRVSDHGTGVPEELRARIFEPGFSTRPKSHRSGLGLSIAGHMLARFGGTIAYEPGSPRGSTFVIRLAAFRGEDE